jgi:hypothetical protein
MAGQFRQEGQTLSQISVDAAPSRSQLRWFGLVIAAFFGILGVVANWQFEARGSALGLWATGGAAAFVYYAIPPLRIPLFLGWMALVSPIGWLVSHLVLVLIFYGLITPLALVMRLFGRDRLERRFPSEAASLWSPREQVADTERYFRQS